MTIARPVSNRRTHVVTGATGFVGSALVLELLMRTEGPIVAIVRPQAGVEPSDRLRVKLQDLITGYGLPESLRTAVLRRVRAVAGDIEQDGCGIDSGTSFCEFADAEFWHCAASLQYQDRHRDRIERTNVVGTANVVELADRSHCSIFNMVSTAYVAGSRTGPIKPERADVAYVNNCYERSKILAEDQVLKSGLRARILRPSVVIGHSRTAHTTSTDGLYGFVRNLTKFRNALNRTQDGLARSLEVSIHVDPTGEIDLVPVDSVVEDAVSLSCFDAQPGFYHLTNSQPARIRDAVEVCFELSGLALPRLTDGRAVLSDVDQKLQQRIDFYSSYLVNSKRFDRSSVHCVLGSRTRPGHAIDRAELARFSTWYLDLLESARRVPVLR